MALANEDKEEILELIEQAINARPEVKNSNVRYELDLRERTVHAINGGQKSAAHPTWGGDVTIPTRCYSGRNLLFYSGELSSSSDFM